jgi:hypothetical protein
MSNRIHKKLALRIETLRTISGADLGAVQGGGETTACTITIETRQCAVAHLYDHSTINDTVYRPGGDPPAQNDTVYRGGGGKAIPV